MKSIVFTLTTSVSREEMSKAYMTKRPMIFWVRAEDAHLGYPTGKIRATISEVIERAPGLLQFHGLVLDLIGPELWAGFGDTLKKHRFFGNASNYIAGGQIKVEQNRIEENGNPFSYVP